MNREFLHFVTVQKESNFAMLPPYMRASTMTIKTQVPTMAMAMPS
uniref:Uncharacterized protein n=1 Tax=Arundo donax TaxID=35708 RepID=A0A0A9HPP5_ARUDO